MAPPEPASGALHKVLIVEDDRDIRDIVREALERAGLVTESAADVAAAEELGDAFEPDLLLVDVEVGGEDGADLLERLRRVESLANTPVVFLAAAYATHDISRYLRLGALDVLMKPFNHDSLAEQLREMWAARPGA